MISSQAIKYRAWKPVKSHIMQHQFMARMGQCVSVCVCALCGGIRAFCQRTTLCHKLHIDCEGKPDAVQQQVTGLHKMNALSVKLDMLMKRQCTSICHQTYCQQRQGIIFGDKTAITKMMQVTDILVIGTDSSKLIPSSDSVSLNNA